MPIGINVGLSTHHQDQSITLHNFNTTNATVSRVHNEVPPLT
jgi:hypothetical protein